MMKPKLPPSSPLVDGKRGMLTREQYRKARLHLTLQLLSWAGAIAGAVLLGVLLFLLSQRAELQSALAESRAQTQKAYGFLAAVFNGQGLVDRSTGTGYIFEKPVAVPFR